MQAAMAVGNNIVQRSSCKARPVNSTALLLCCCRWVAFVEAVQNDTTEKAQEAYNRLLLAVTDMELMVRRRNASSFSNSSCRVLQANSKI
jgi:hypothetical protein